MKHYNSYCSEMDQECFHDCPFCPDDNNYLYDKDEFELNFMDDDDLPDYFNQFNDNDNF